MRFETAADERCWSLIQEIGNRPAVVVEIGVYVGRLSGRLLARHRGVYLHMVDPWAETGADSYAQTGDFMAKQDAARHEAVMVQALRSVAPYQGRYTVQRMTSEQASRLYVDESIDAVFIDGDHSYEGCSTDIRLWWPKVRPGGVLSGHDYRTDKDFGVIRAVDEFKGNRELRLGLNHTWFITKGAE